MPDLEPAETGREPALPGTTRRGILRGTAGIGAAGLAVGVLGTAIAGPASAATAAPDHAAAHSGPLVVHVHDARSGVVDLYVGEQHVRFTDRELAARLARAAG